LLLAGLEVFVIKYSLDSCSPLSRGQVYPCGSRGGNDKDMQLCVIPAKAGIYMDAKLDCIGISFFPLPFIPSHKGRGK